MKNCDPRLWGVKKPWSALLCFIGLTLLFAWGNVRLQRGGFLDEDVLLRADDPFRRMDRYVQGKVEEGFEGREVIPFVLHGGIQSAEDLQKILRLTEAVQEAFGDAVFSLSEAPAYRDTGETLFDEPYITGKELTDPSFALNEWKEQVARDPAVYGLLVGRDFSWALAARYLAPGYDEITEFRRTVEFLEDRAIPWWEWLWKRDITPRDPAVGVGGWTMGRGLIDQGLNVDILSLVFLGVFLTLPVFWVALGSFRAALLSVSVMIAGGFVWTRGTMGLVDIDEQIFSLLAFANVIVQGTSFALHKFEALAASGAQDSATGWQRARSVDSLIATIAGIAVFGFGSLWTFGLKPIRELGVASALGVAWLWLLAVFFLPGLHLLCGQERSFPSPTRLDSLGGLFQRGLERLTSGCLRAAMWLAAGRRPLGVIAFTLGLFGVTAALFVQGQILCRTRPLDFIRGTSVEKEARFLNQPGGLGFEFLDLLVEPGQGGTIDDPRFLQRAWAFQAALKQIAGARETASILSVLHQIARESFHKTLPETETETGTAFFLIENRLEPALRDQFYFLGGIRLAVSFSMDDSVEVGRFCEEILALARKDFPDLKVSAFNKVPLYPRVDQYVRQGKIANVFVSQLGVALLCGLVIFWRNRRLVQSRLSPLRGGLVMSLPLLFATAVMGLLMWGLEIPLDMSTAPINALAINAATDFSLYLAMTYQAALHAFPPQEALKHAMEREGKIIVADCLLNTLCFLPLVTSRFLPVQQLGWMMGVMLTTCAAGALLFMAALLPHCVVRKNVGN
jgi:predicted RND superfamily exporter protein